MPLRKALLGKRLIAATRLARWELQLANAARRALDRQRKHALSVVHQTYGARGVVASIPPNVFDLDTWSDDMDDEVTVAAQGIFDEIRKTTAGRFLTRPGELPEIDVRHRLDRVLDQMQGLGPATSDAIGQTLTKGVAVGESIDKLSSRIQSVFDSSDARATLIARTEVVGASNGLSHDYAEAVNATGTIALQRTWLATIDDRTRPDHADADGQTVEGFDEPYDVGGEELMYPGDENGSPENVCNCRAVAPDTSVRADQLVSVSRRPFHGELVRLTLASGDQLTAASEHPVLTGRGFIAAGLLGEGDHVVRCLTGQDATARNPEVDHVPATVEELYETIAFAARSTQRIRRVGVDLYGYCIHGHVKVARSEYGLSVGLRAPAAQHADEIQLALTHREMSFTGDASALGGINEPQMVGFAYPASFDTGSAQSGSHHVPGYVERSSDRQFAFASSVPLDHSRIIETSVAESGCADAVCAVAVRSHKAAASELGDEGGAADVRSLARLLDVEAGEVELDRVIDARREWFKGHVYDVQTRSAWFIANGIVVHNCTEIFDEAGTDHGDDLHLDA